MPKMKKKMMEIKSTLSILGMDYSNALIEIYRPRFLLIILRGLRTLINLTILNTPTSISLNDMDNKERITMTKSRTFHWIAKQLWSPLNMNPDEIIFKHASSTKMLENILSRRSRIYWLYPLGALRGFSRARSVLDTSIINIIMFSNSLCSIIFYESRRSLFWRVNIKRLLSSPSVFATSAC